MSSMKQLETRVSRLEKLVAGLLLKEIAELKRASTKPPASSAGFVEQVKPADNLMIKLTPTG